MTGAEARDSRGREFLWMGLILFGVAILLFILDGLILNPLPENNSNWSFLRGPAFILMGICLVGGLNSLLWMKLHRTNAKWRPLQISSLAIASFAVTVAIVLPIAAASTLMFPIPPN